MYGRRHCARTLGPTPTTSTRWGRLIWRFSTLSATSTIPIGSSLNGLSTWDLIAPSIVMSVVCWSDIELPLELET